MPTPSAPLRLLFVEDDAAIVQGLQYALTQEGYAVTHAGSLAAARAALPAGFDLLLLDVRLPDGSGFDLLREARRRNPEQPAVFLTACDDEIHTVLGLDLGADDYIAKPFRLQELLSRLPCCAGAAAPKPARCPAGCRSICVGPKSVAAANRSA